MNFFQWALIILLYLFCGLLYSFIYMWVYNPEENEVWIGIMVFIWPLYLILDILLQMARGFGKNAKLISNKLFNRIK